MAEKEKQSVESRTKDAVIFRTLHDELDYICLHSVGRTKIDGSNERFVFHSAWHCNYIRNNIYIF